MRSKFPHPLAEVQYRSCPVQRLRGLFWDPVAGAVRKVTEYISGPYARPSLKHVAAACSSVTSREPYLLHWRLFYYGRRVLGDSRVWRPLFCGLLLCSLTTRCRLGRRRAATAHRSDAVPAEVGALPPSKGAYVT